MGEAPNNGRYNVVIPGRFQPVTIAHIHKVIQLVEVHGAEIGTIFFGVIPPLHTFCLRDRVLSENTLTLSLESVECDAVKELYTQLLRRTQSNEGDDRLKSAYWQTVENRIDIFPWDTDVADVSRMLPVFNVLNLHEVYHLLYDVLGARQELVEHSINIRCVPLKPLAALSNPEDASRLCAWFGEFKWFIPRFDERISQIETRIEKLTAPFNRLIEDDLGGVSVIDATCERLDLSIYGLAAYALYDHSVQGTIFPEKVIECLESKQSAISTSDIALGDISRLLENDGDKQWFLEMVRTFFPRKGQEPTRIAIAAANYDKIEDEIISLSAQLNSYSAGKAWPDVLNAYFTEWKEVVNQQLRSIAGGNAKATVVAHRLFVWLMYSVLYAHSRVEPTLNKPAFVPFKISGKGLATEVRFSLFMWEGTLVFKPDGKLKHLFIEVGPTATTPPDFSDSLRYYIDKHKLDLISLRELTIHGS